MRKVKIVGLIPARMNSSRFPGKPIKKILGKPMVYWVYQQALKVKQLDEIYVVTEDQIIVDVCEKYNVPCWFENEETSCAAEKLSYTSRKMNADIYLNIQGDEPLISPNAIKQVISYMLENPDVYYLGLFSKIDNEAEFNNRNVVKTVMDKDGYAHYFSRSPIPEKFNPNVAARVLGLYGYRSDFLKKFADFPKDKNEILESGVEMLRAMAQGYKIKLIETQYTTIGVDLPEHIALVEEQLLANSKNN